MGRQVVEVSELGRCRRRRCDRMNRICWMGRRGAGGGAGAPSEGGQPRLLRVSSSSAHFYPSAVGFDQDRFVVGAVKMSDISGSRRGCWAALSMNRSKTEWSYSGAVFYRFGSRAPEGRRTPGRWRKLEQAFAVQGPNARQKRSRLSMNRSSSSGLLRGPGGAPVPSLKGPGMLRWSGICRQCRPYRDLGGSVEANRRFMVPMHGSCA